MQAFTGSPTQALNNEIAQIRNISAIVACIGRNGRLKISLISKILEGIYTKKTKIILSPMLLLKQHN